MAAKVPAVPGAKGKYPLPHPVAMNLIRDLFRPHLTQVVGQAIPFSRGRQQEIPREIPGPTGEGISCRQALPEGCLPRKSVIILGR